MLLCSNKILGDGESRHRVNDRHKCLGWNKQHTPFISGRESLMHPPHTKRRREATLEPGHCHGSLWLVQSSSLINQLKLLGPLGRCKLAHGEVNSMQAQVFMPRHVDSFCRIVFSPHIHPFYFTIIKHSVGVLYFVLTLLFPAQEGSTLWTSSYLSLTISLKECNNWREVGGGGILGHSYLDFYESHMYNYLRRIALRISKRN